MTAPNAALAYAVLDQIDANPDGWDQENWVNQCGTAYCFAGWALRLTSHSLQARGGETELDGESVWDQQVSDAAARELGIHGEDHGSTADALFQWTNTREELGRLTAEIFGPRPDVIITDHVFRPPHSNGSLRSDEPDRCVYANCGHPRAEHIRSVGPHQSRARQP